MTTTEFTNGHALLIGVGRCKYSDWSLPITVKDAEALRDALVDPTLCAYPNNDNHIKLLTNEEATRQGIMEGLEWLQDRVTQDREATAVVYFSGHGWTEISSGRYFLIPHDVTSFNIPKTALLAESFTQALRELPAKRLLVIIDSCHAAGMADAKDGHTPAEVEMPESFIKSPLPTDYIEALTQGAGRVVFSSCKENEKSLILAGDAHSLYTKHLLEALSGRGSQAGDTTVTVSVLMKYLGRAVVASAQTVNRFQTPVFKMESEDFPIAMLLGGKGLPTAGERTKPTVSQPSAPTIQFTAKAKDESQINQASGNVASAQGSGLAIGGNVGGDVNLVKGGRQIIDRRHTTTYNFNSSGLSIDPSKSNDPYNLRTKMTKHLMRQEILNIIHDLEMDQNLLPGDNLGEKVIALIDYCQKRGRTEELLQLCESANEYINWRESK